MTEGGPGRAGGLRENRVYPPAFPVSSSANFLMGLIVNTYVYSMENSLPQENSASISIYIYMYLFSSRFNNMR